MKELTDRIAEIKGEIYRPYRIVIRFTERVYGGLLADAEAMEKYLAAKFSPEDPTREAVKADLDLDKEQENMTTVFKRDAHGLYLGNHQIKAMLAQSASTLGITSKKRGSKQTFKEGCIVNGIGSDDADTGRKLYFHPNREKADGIETITGNVQTPQGSRSILKASEYVEKAELKFCFAPLVNRVALSGKGLTEKDILTILVNGQNTGLGSLRSLEEGKFEILEFSPPA